MDSTATKVFAHLVLNKEVWVGNSRVLTSSYTWSFSMGVGPLGSNEQDMCAVCMSISLQQNNVRHHVLPLHYQQSQ